MTDAAAVTPSASASKTENGEYDQLVPVQRRYAELAVDDPERQRLRGQLISGYLPVAETYRAPVRRPR
jgi:hypothetical protein